MDDVIYLVGENFEQDMFGVLHPVTIERKVYCKVNSIGSREWFDGGRLGLKPEFQFVTFRYDYQGEKVVKFHGDYYAVYRTYIDGDNIELYTERREGYEQL